MKRLQLIDDLRPLTNADYAAVIEKYTEECRSIPGVRAIYQFGNVGAPGFSDVDLVVVLDSDAPTDNRMLSRLSIYHERWQLDPLVRACFVHDVYVCPSDAFAHVEYLVPGNAWTLRAGDAVETMLPDAGEREIIALVHGLDFCVGRLHEMAHLEDGAQHSVRWLIPQLWSLTHTHRLLTDADVQLERSWDDVIGALKTMRTTPICAIEHRDISPLVSAVRQHFAIAVDCFAATLASRADLGPEGPRRECSIAVRPRRALYVYAMADRHRKGPHTTATSLTRSFRFAHRTVHARWTRLTLPDAVLLHHLAYLVRDPSYKGIVSRIATRAKTSGGESGSKLYRSVIARRWAAARLSDQWISASRMRLSGFGIPGLPMSPAGASANDGTWKFRAVRSWLDSRLLPAGAVRVGRG